MCHLVILINTHLSKAQLALVTAKYIGVSLWCLPVVEIAIVFLYLFLGEVLVTDFATIGRWQPLGSLASNKFRHSASFV